jgi:hypothetical protein
MAPRNPFMDTKLYLGFVESTDDNSKFGRVLITVPGLLDRPQYADVVQLGSPFNRGTFSIPVVGTQVVVGFLGGDYQSPLILGAITPPPEAGGLRANLTPEELPKIQTIESDNWTVVFGEESTSLPYLTITSRREPKLSITLDLSQNMIELSAPAAVSIKSAGMIKLEGQLVQINDRPVQRNGRPI